MPFPKIIYQRGYLDEIKRYCQLLGTAPVHSSPRSLIMQFDESEKQLGSVFSPEIEPKKQLVHVVLLLWFNSRFFVSCLYTVSSELERVRLVLYSDVNRILYLYKRLLC